MIERVHIRADQRRTQGRCQRHIVQRRIQHGQDVEQVAYLMASIVTPSPADDEIRHAAMRERLLVLLDVRQAAQQHGHIAIADQSPRRRSRWLVSRSSCVSTICWMRAARASASSRT